MYVLGTKAHVMNVTQRSNAWHFTTLCWSGSVVSKALSGRTKISTPSFVDCKIENQLYHSKRSNWRLQSVKLLTRTSCLIGQSSISKPPLRRCEDICHMMGFVDFWAHLWEWVWLNAAVSNHFSIVQSLISCYWKVSPLTSSLITIADVYYWYYSTARCIKTLIVSRYITN